MRVTPDNITDLKQGQIFVFGSNLAGRHGKGAAKLALKWGAKYGQAEGLQGSTYAIPTKDKTVKNTLSLAEIAAFVERFVVFAKTHPNLTFLVTEIGCGLAGYHPVEIAPLFVSATLVETIWLPQRFWTIIHSLR